MTDQQTAVAEPSHRTDQDEPRSTSGAGGAGGGGAATAVRTRPRTAPPRVERMPLWKVLLHNDDVNDLGYVAQTIVELTAANPRQALLQTLEAHSDGLAILLTTHRERAELLQEQFASKRLTVTIEPER